MNMTAFFVCDDIRNEIDNKVSLIGVYGNAINFEPIPEIANPWPKMIKLGLFARFSVSEEDKKNLPTTVGVSVRRDKETAQIGKGLLDAESIRQSSLVNIVIVNPGFQISGLGSLVFIYEFFDSAGKLIYKKESEQIEITQNKTK